MKALQVEGWLRAKPPRKTRENNRVLRQRDCNPPRLTTKTPNPEVRRVRNRAA